MKKTAKEIKKEVCTLLTWFRPDEDYYITGELLEQINSQVDQALEMYADQWRPKDQVSRQTILEAVLSYCFVSEFDLVSTCRDRELVDARAIYSMLCRGLTSMTFQEIGQVLNRGHYTVIHYLKNVVIVPSVRKKYLEIYNILLPIK